MLETLDDIKTRGFVGIPISDIQTPFHTIYMAYKEKAFRSCVTDQLIEFARNFAKFPSGKIGDLRDYYRREQIECGTFLFTNKPCSKPIGLSLWVERFAGQNS